MLIIIILIEKTAEIFIVSLILYSKFLNINLLF